LFKRLKKGKYIMAGFPCCCPTTGTGTGTECNACFCDNCADGFMPCCWQVIIAGMTSTTGTGSCDTCERLEKTYLLSDYDPEGTGTGTGTGTGSGETGGDCFAEDERVCGECGAERISLRVVEESGDYIIRVTLGDHVWEKNYGTSKPVCCSLLNEVIPHVTSGGVCDSDSSSCTITALGDSVDCTSARCGVLTCTDCSNWPSEIAVDLAEGGWLTSTCSYCPNVEGIYVLDGPADDETDCSSNLSDLVCLGEGGEDGIFTITLEVVVGPSSTRRWELVVDLEHLAQSTTATYHSGTWEPTPKPECWNLEDAEGRIQLTKTSESTESAACADPDFGGQLPDTIYMWDANA
jgi:hypothetical protein